MTTLLVISPDFASHYGPLAVLGRAARAEGIRVVVATGAGMRTRAEADGFEWRFLQLSATSNDGLVDESPAINRFIDATRSGAIATIRRQALDREHDLLWEPERIGVEIAKLCDDLDPDQVLVDHVSFGSTLGMHATARPYVTLVPGHPSQLPLGRDRYGIPTTWPACLQPDQDELSELEALVDRVTATFTARWNRALASLAPHANPVADAFRIHGRRVLYNSTAALHDASRCVELPVDHRFVGPLVRDEELPSDLRSWAGRNDERAQVYVALGTFLSLRSDVLHRIVAALGQVDARAAVATGSTAVGSLGPIPPDWLIAPQLPQVALLQGADLALHHGGNNSVQEALAAGVRQIVLPFSTDQFANAADLERAGAADVLAPNTATVAELADTITASLSRPAPPPPARPTAGDLVRAVFDRGNGAAQARRLGRLRSRPPLFDRQEHRMSAVGCLADATPEPEWCGAAW